MLYSIDDIKKIVSPVAKQYGVERIWLFGSYARGDATEDSDIDFRLDSGKVRGYFQLGGLYNALEKVLNKKFDLITTGSMDEEFLEQIAKYEVLIYDNQS